MKNHDYALLSKIANETLAKAKKDAIKKNKTPLKASSEGRGENKKWH